jgi:hypothetical protein
LRAARPARSSCEFSEQQLQASASLFTEQPLLAQTPSGWDDDDDATNCPLAPQAWGVAPMPSAPVVAAASPFAAAPLPPASRDACGAPLPPPQAFVSVQRRGTGGEDDLDDLVGDLLTNDSSVVGYGLVPGFHCTGCDFQVMQVDDYIWNGDVDYMFFRNNYPTFEKLRRGLSRRRGCRAYCCQCSWKSAELGADLEDVAVGLRWRKVVH